MKKSTSVLIGFVLFLFLGCTDVSEINNERYRIEVHEGQSFIEFENYIVMIDLDRQYPVLIILEDGAIIHGIDLDPASSRVSTHRYYTDRIEIIYDTNGDGFLDGFYKIEK